MKPIPVILLILGGALGGALIMKVAQKPKLSADVAGVAKTATPPPTQTRESPGAATKSDTHESSSPTAPPPSDTGAPSAPQQVSLNAGTVLPVRLLDGLTTERSLAGDPFVATLDKALVVNGAMIADRGARVEGRVVAADRGGKVKGVASLTVELTRLHIAGGRTVPIQTDRFAQKAETSHTEDTVKVGAGAAIGAAIGAITGGGKGAAIGAGVGGGAGTGDVLLTRGKAAELPTETRLTFRLKTAVRLTKPAQR